MGGPLGEQALGILGEAGERLQWLEQPVEESAAPRSLHGGREASPGRAGIDGD